MMFPAESVPDATALAAHHYLQGTVMVWFAATYAWDKFTDREPWYLLSASVFGGFMFALLWEYHPVGGAVLSGLAIPVIAIGLVRFRHYATRTPYMLAVVGWLFMIDDWVSHALGVWTPLDQAFVYIAPYLS